MTEINSHIIYLSKKLLGSSNQERSRSWLILTLTNNPTSQHFPTLSYAKFSFLAKGLIYEVKNVSMNTEGTETIYIFVVVPC